MAASLSVATGRVPAPPRSAQQFSVFEATIPAMRQAMQEGRVTARELVTQYLVRIATYEDGINAVLAMNPRALAEADLLDAERAQGRIRGPLHGIPVALKDNIQATGMPTTGGALAFEGWKAPYDATLTKNLRDAGAIIIAKTVLTELANWVAGPPTPMPGNYSALGGLSYNPYDPRRDPREGVNDGRSVLSTGGSSSGAGTAANFWAANVGTDTSGSITNPAQLNMLVGIRPTTGRISRHGIIPITLDQDTAGPMARTVTDAAILLGVLESAAPDPHDAATARCAPPAGRDYTRFLRRDGLRGARIGIPRAFFYQRMTIPGEEKPRGGLDADKIELMTQAIDVLEREGAVIVDPANLPSVLETDRAKHLLAFDTCSGSGSGKGGDAGCSVVLKYGMKRDFNAWLGALGASAPLKSLTELRMFNLTHMRGNAIRYGQANLDISDEMDLQADRARYEADRAKDLLLAEERGLKAALVANRLDALVFSGWPAAGIAARPGYPMIVVPFGEAPALGPDPYPPGFTPLRAPQSVSFVGLACSEPRLLELSYAFEQATRRRVPPPSTP